MMKTNEMFVGGLTETARIVKSRYIVLMESVGDHDLLRALRDQSPPVMRMWDVPIGELGLVCMSESIVRTAWIASKANFTTAAFSTNSVSLTVTRLTN